VAAARAAPAPLSAFPIFCPESFLEKTIVLKNETDKKRRFFSAVFQKAPFFLPAARAVEALRREGYQR
jgi:hypothetical protein